MVKALSLFSGGLDSILAARIVIDQGVDVVAVQFVTPFFGLEQLADAERFQEETRKKYGLEVLVEDISSGYLELLKNPEHGYGKNFNPCVDCKIFMLKRAREMMAELGASFLVTGEVIGQRPMSQRRDTLNVIARDSESRSLLLRPLSAKLMKPTIAEEKGWVDRDKLYDFNGRGRAKQIALAKTLGIEDFPAPAGGCVLSDPILSRRIRKVYENDFVVCAEDIIPEDITLMINGRQFALENGGWLVLGRDERENDLIEGLVREDDATFYMEDRPGPFGVLRRAAVFFSEPSQLRRAFEQSASLVVRYGKKVAGWEDGADVTVCFRGNVEIIPAKPMEDDVFRPWLF